MLIFVSIRNCDNSVGIMKGYGLGDLGSIPGRDKSFAPTYLLEVGGGNSFTFFSNRNWFDNSKEVGACN
jgi:hypothetical protein